MHISIAFDEVYAQHGAATIASILATSAPENPPEFHVLDNGVSNSTQDRIREYVQAKAGKIHFIKVDPERFGSFPATHHPVAAYSRLALPELLPRLNRVLYLDSDLIVLKSLSALWETALGTRAAAVVRDAADVFGGHFVAHKHQLGLRPDQPAFNSGVMLLNLANWRENALTETVVDWIEKNAHLMRHSDQDALNAVLKDQVSFLDEIWNVQAPLIRAVQYGVIDNPEWIRAVQHPSIIHYTTSSKPWVVSCAVPRRKDYRRFAGLCTKTHGSSKLPGPKAVLQRILSEVVEFRWWLAAFIKRRLRRI